ncbi:cobalt-precorrin 5A hydrolase, partial [Klebsiella pneumoniae]
KRAGVAPAGSPLPGAVRNLQRRGAARARAPLSGLVFCPGDGRRRQRLRPGGLAAESGKPVRRNPA